jgi:hypothetical protein
MAIPDVITCDIVQDNNSIVFQIFADDQKGQYLTGHDVRRINNAKIYLAANFVNAINDISSVKASLSAGLLLAAKLRHLIPCLFRAIAIQIFRYINGIQHRLDRRRLEDVYGRSTFRNPNLDNLAWGEFLQYVNKKIPLLIGHLRLESPIITVLFNISEDFNLHSLTLLEELMNFSAKTKGSCPSIRRRLKKIP